MQKDHHRGWLLPFSPLLPLCCFVCSIIAHLLATRTASCLCRLALYGAQVIVFADMIVLPQRDCLLNVNKQKILSKWLPRSLSVGRN